MKKSPYTLYNGRGEKVITADIHTVRRGMDQLLGGAYIQYNADGIADYNESLTIIGEIKLNKERLVELRKIHLAFIKKLESSCSHMIGNKTNDLLDECEDEIRFGEINLKSIGIFNRVTQ